MAETFAHSGESSGSAVVPTPRLQGIFIPGIDTPNVQDGFGLITPLGGGLSARQYTQYGVSNIISPQETQIHDLGIAPAEGNIFNFEGLVGARGKPGVPGIDGVTTLLHLYGPVNSNFLATLPYNIGQINQLGTAANTMIYVSSYDATRNFVWTKTDIDSVVKSWNDSDINTDASFFIIAADAGIYVSRNEGDNWSKYNPDGDTYKQTSCESSGGDAVVLGTNGKAVGTFLITNDYGVNWTEITIPAGISTGADLATGTTAGNTLPEPWPPTEPEEREITFDSPVELTNGVTYAIVIRAIGADINNPGVWMVKLSGAYPNGSRHASDDSGSSWTALTSNDLWFQTKASGITKESYTFAHAGAGVPFWDTSWVAQTFLAESTYNISSVVLRLHRAVGALPGTITVSIKEYNNDVIIRSVKLGANGAFIVVAANAGIYLSTDSGDNWSRKTPDDVEDTDWEKGICSSDGTYIIVVSNADAIYRSANSGSSWAQITPAEGDTFSVNKMATSDDGQFMVIVGQNSTDATESCYISTDYGVTWTAKKPVSASIEYSECDISNDGTVITVSTTSNFYISFDSGAAWKEQGMASTAEVWKGLSISGDGTTGLVANINNNDEFFIGINTELFSRATWAESIITSAGRALLDDVTVADQNTTLGFGTGDSPTLTGLTLSGLTPTRVMFAGEGGLLVDDAGLTFVTNTLFSTNLTASGTVQAEQLTSTDDITMQGHLFTMGNGSPNASVIKYLGAGGSESFITFSGGGFDFTSEAGTSAEFGRNVIVQGTSQLRGIVSIGNAYNLPSANGTANFLVKTDGSTQWGYVDPAQTGTGDWGFWHREDGTGIIITLTAGDNVTLGGDLGVAENLTVGNTTTPDAFGRGIFASTTNPVVSITRDFVGALNERANAALLERTAIDQTALDNIGIGFVFKAPNDAGESIECGGFGGRLEDVSDGVEVGALVFAAAWRNEDTSNREDLVILATSTIDGSIVTARDQLWAGQNALIGAKRGTDIATAGAKQVLHVFDNGGECFLLVQSGRSSTNDLAGIKFSTYPGTSMPGSFAKSMIVLQEKGDFAVGDLVFCNDPDESASEVTVADEVMRMTATGLIVTGTIAATGGNSTEWNTSFDNMVTDIAFNTGDGIITVTQQDSGTLTTDSLDGRYYTETELSSVSNGVGASLIGVEDAMSIFTATDVEGALEEIMDRITPVTYSANAIATTQGTPTGDVTDVQTINDGNEYLITEATGAPGFITTVTFTGIVEGHEANKIQAHYSYNGNHTITLQIEKAPFDGSAWDDVITVTNTGGVLTFLDVEIGGTITDYFNSGVTKIRWNHIGAGNINHDFVLDYNTIKDDSGSVSGITEHGGLSGRGDDDHTQYHTDARAAIWLAANHETTFTHADIATNTAKVTNATHTGEVTGSGALTAQPVMITGKDAATVASGDLVLVSDINDSNILKKVTAQSIGDLGGGGGDKNTDGGFANSTYTAPQSIDGGNA